MFLVKAKETTVTIGTRVFSPVLATPFHGDLPPDVADRDDLLLIEEVPDEQPKVAPGGLSASGTLETTPGASAADGAPQGGPEGPGEGDAAGAADGAPQGGPEGPGEGDAAGGPEPDPFADLTEGPNAGGASPAPAPTSAAPPRTGGGGKGGRGGRK